MKFKKLSVYGFKSFADKLEIKFGDGITAIVGPNGCGKSNVADAMRWVLGEQSAKTLRGSSMQDVIFNGTDNRLPMSYAEVSLIFNNKNKELFPNCLYEEVTVTRKLFRSGESQYFMNGADCKLRDITALLRDGGFGREGYTIIGQGKIDDLLNSKPENRRAIFEEAAGIIKFRQQKTEAENRLRRAQDNLDKLSLVMNTKQDALRPLARQAANAQKMIELERNLKIHEINTYINQYENASDIKAEMQSALDALNARSKELEDAIERLNIEYNNAATSRGSVDEKIEAYHKELTALTVGAEKKVGEINLINERIKTLNSKNDTLITENESLSRQYENNAAALRNATEHLGELQDKLSQDKGEYERVNDEFVRIGNKITEGENDYRNANRELLEATNKLSTIRANMSSLTTEKSGLETNIESMDSRIFECNERINVAKNLYEREKNDFDALAYDKNELSEGVEGLTSELNEMITVSDKTSSEYNELSLTYSSDKTKFTTYKELSADYNGFAGSVRRLLKDAEHNPEVRNRFEAVVGKILTVDSKFEMAINVSLGNSISNVITRNEDDAKYLIGYLKEKKYGRATFLPLTSFKTHSIDSRHLSALNREGCYGIAADLVKYDSKYDVIIKGLLGGTVITENIDYAVKLARDTGYSFRIATLDGDFINPQGSITGGSKSAEVTNVFAYERQLKELTEAIATAEVRLKELAETRDRTKKSISDSKTRLDELSVKLKTIEINLNGKRASCDRLTESIENYTRQLDSITAEKEMCIKRISEIDAQINSVSELEQVIKSNQATAESIGTERQNEFAELRAAHSALNDKVINCSMNVVKTEKDIASTKSDIARYKSFLENASERINANRAGIEENNRYIDDFNESLRFVSEESAGNDSARIKELNDALANFNEYKQSLERKIAESDTMRMELVNERQTLMDKMRDQEVNLSRIDNDILAMKERVSQAYELDYEGCLEYRAPDYDVQTGYLEISRIKRQMQSLGEVNRLAITQAQEMFKEYHECEIQFTDLQNAKADAESVIQRISDEMIEIFNTEFEKIRTNFKSIFKEMFNGGTADLVLVDNPEDKLRSGIEIVAQPPSKKLQSISLLSGGEKALTAIAILFAILKLKPMPFCVLDEIEAALDDANVGRFASYLKNFSRETQFIVITHRKPTMEQSDSLFGVTMQEKGVTKIVSVKLEDAVQQAEVI